MPRIDHVGWENYNSEIKFETEGEMGLRDISTVSVRRNALSMRRARDIMDVSLDTQP